ncbi:MAG TPA: metallophosphoesterase [Pseudolabrys sp.]|nr:metallophosphoesterase [Pseudolabrys sp.]
MFTLAHLSDPHLAPLPPPRWRELISKRLTGYINWQRRRRFIHEPTVLAKIVADLKAQAPGHIAVTGDIANIALPEEFTRGRAWLESLGSQTDVSFVPGNHDAYVPEAGVLADRAWRPFMSEDDDTARFPFARRRRPLGLIGVSTGVPTPPFFATGFIGNEQLAALALTLDELKAEKLFRVVLIHHPPVSDAARHKRLIDAHILLHVIATHGVELVLHGHDHLHMINWLDGPNGARVPAVGVPSASAAWGMSTDAAAYNLYVIDGAPGAWTCELISRGIGAAGTVMQQRRLKLLG